MQWEPLGTTSQYKQLVLITHVKIACYLITWASFHPKKHITALCSHHLCPSSLTGFGLSLLISQGKKKNRFGQGRRKNRRCLTGIPAAHVSVPPCLPPAHHGVLLLHLPGGCSLLPCLAISVPPFHPCSGDGVTYFIPCQGSSRPPSELPQLAET